MLITSQYFAVRSIVISVSVCLSVCPPTYLKNYMTKLNKLFCTC